MSSSKRPDRPSGILLNVGESYDVTRCQSGSQIKSNQIKSKRRMYYSPLIQRMALPKDLGNIVSEYLMISKEEVSKNYSKVLKKVCCISVIEEICEDVRELVDLLNLDCPKADP